MIPFFFTCLVSYDNKPGAEAYRVWALVILIVASLTDALDGFIARAWKIRTELGRFLDPLADKLLLLSGYLGLLFVQQLPFHPPLWITVTIVFRDLLIVTGMILIYFISGRLRVQPNYLGKCTTALQMITLIAILANWKISIPLYYLMAAFTILSMINYSVRELRLLKNGS